MKSLPIVLIALVLAGCGPFVAGTWTDDPKNCKRAFGESRPADGISIVRSWYMRTPHFTAEFAWFFELELSEQAKKMLTSNLELSRLTNVAPEDLRSRMYHDRPRWFSPEPLPTFDVYESKLDRDFLMRRVGVAPFGHAASYEKRAQQGARANDPRCHASCRATSRASEGRGSSLTLGKAP